MFKPIDVSFIRDYFKDKPWLFRLKLVDKELPSNWSKWILNPSGNYIEIENSEPVLISEVDWIEINPIESKRIGKLVPDQKIDHSSEIFRLLDSLVVEYKIDNGIIKIKNTPTRANS